MATKIIFFGNERLATGVTTSAPTLRALIDAGYEVIAVAVSQHATQSRHARQLEIELVATEHDIPIWRPEKLADLTTQITSSSAELGVLVAFGRIIPQAIIDLFPHGIINLHPSRLPLHRGPIPIESVILGGEPVTAVSVMQLASQMDAGPVWHQTILELDGTESKQLLADTLLELGAQALINVLPSILDRSGRPTPQTDTDATTDQRLSKSDGQLDWSKPAVQLEREIRAYLGWPGSYATLSGRDVTITAAHVENGQLGIGQIDTTSRILCIGTSQDVLVVDQLKPAGKREMTATDFLAGWR